MKATLWGVLLAVSLAQSLTPQDKGEVREALPAPELKAKPEPADFDLRGDARTLYREVAHRFGLDCTFDDDFVAGSPIHFQLQDVTYQEALHALEAATGSFVVTVSDRVFLVVKDTPQNRLGREPTVTMSVRMRTVENTQQLTEVIRAVQQTIGLEKVAVNAQSSTVAFVGPLSKVIPARQLFEDLMRQRPQVSVELEMVEVTRNDMLTWGLTLPNTFPIAAPNSGAEVLTTLAQLARWWSGGAGLALTIADAQLAAQMSQSINKSLLHLELRSLDSQPATFHVGDRYPILTSAYVGGQSTSTPVSATPTNGSNGTNTISPNNARVFGSVTQPSGIVARDFNGDNVLDLATASAGTDSIAVLIGNGDGTFRDAVTTPAGKAPAAIAAVDLNADGSLDLITANAGSNSISVLLGNGDGTFQPAAQFAVGSTPSALATGDFDGDGHVDIAVANADSDDVTVLLGKGDGTFWGVVTTSAGSGPRSLVAADFNGDGHTDLAVANFKSNDVTVLMSNGDGSFRKAATYPAGNGPRAIAADTVDQGSQLDLVVANSASNTVSIFLGDGAGGFAQGVQFPTGPNPLALEIGDFNSDGLKDVVVTDPDNGTLSLLLGLGNGSFQSPISLRTGAAATSVVRGDFNGDSLLDLVTANQASGDFSILLGYGNAGFHDPGGNGYDSSGGTSYAPPPSFTFEDLGLVVKVTPHVHGMDEVVLDIEAEFKLLTGQASNGMPVFSNRKLVSRVTAHNGEWGVIAGLLTSSDAHSISGGLPGLSSLKLVGPLLRKNTRERGNNQILVLIKTHLLDAPPDHFLTQPVRTGSETRPLTRM